MKLSDFMEKHLDIKLLKHQKQFLDRLQKQKANNPNVTYYYQARSGKRIARFYNLYNHLCSMKKDDVVAIMTPKGAIKMNKKEFSEYLKCLWNQIWDW